MDFGIWDGLSSTKAVKVLSHNLAKFMVILKVLGFKNCIVDSNSYFNPPKKQLILSSFNNFNYDTNSTNFYWYSRTESFYFKLTSSDLGSYLMCYQNSPLNIECTPTKLILFFLYWTIGFGPIVVPDLQDELGWLSTLGNCLQRYNQPSKLSPLNQGNLIFKTFVEGWYVLCTSHVAISPSSALVT